MTGDLSRVKSAVKNRDELAKRFAEIKARNTMSPAEAMACADIALEAVRNERARIVNRLQMRAANTRSLKGREALLDAITELVQ
jgi:hypothetical protein